MRSVTQKDMCGCGIACLACVLNVSYDAAILLLKNGKKFAKFKGFTCQEMVRALEKGNIIYKYQYISRGNKNQ